MARQEAGSFTGIKAIKTDELPVNKELELKFVSTRNILTMNGDTNIHTFINSNGKVFALFGTKILDDKLSEVPERASVWLTYLGKKNSPKAVRPYHDFKVEFDPEDLEDAEVIKEFLKEAVEEAKQDPETVEEKAVEVDTTLASATSIFN